MELIVLVPGMSCSHCEAAVKDEVGKVRGVDEVDVDLRTKLVTVTGDDLDVRLIGQAIEEAGYEVVGDAEVR
jgi:copper ion binding protein